MRTTNLCSAYSDKSVIILLVTSLRGGAMKVKSKVKDLSADELKSLISEVVKESIEDLIENILALSSESYLRSIEEARKDYKEGKVKTLSFSST